MSDFNRQLIDLSAELTDEGTVWPLRGMLDHWGRERAALGIADAFAVARSESDACR